MEVKEIWKAIPSYEYMYEVSNLGNVKSLSRENYSGKGMKISKERILKQHKNGRGYLKVVLSKNNFKKQISVHQLVVMAFMGHIPNGKMDLVVDHINDDKLDNRIENLQVVTQSENIHKSYKKINNEYN